MLREKYAVIKIKGSQYIVSEGDELLIPNLKDKEEPGADVLLSVNGSDVEIGRPIVKGKSVKLKVLGKTSEKLDILKYKAKSRYRRRIGFKSIFTKIAVEKIL